MIWSLDSYRAKMVLCLMLAFIDLADNVFWKAPLAVSIGRLMLLD
jgi:hypothetical protein